jgi:hypothetical protein
VWFLACESLTNVRREFTVDERAIRLPLYSPIERLSRARDAWLAWRKKWSRQRSGSGAAGSKTMGQRRVVTPRPEKTSVERVAIRGGWRACSSVAKRVQRQPPEPTTACRSRPTGPEPALPERPRPFRQRGQPHRPHWHKRSSRSFHNWNNRGDDARPATHSRWPPAGRRQSPRRIVRIYLASIYPP